VTKSLTISQSKIEEALTVPCTVPAAAVAAGTLSLSSPH